MFSFFKKRPKQDELVGIWQTTNEGGFHIVMGTELVLNADGTGNMYSWGQDDEEPYEYRHEVQWRRKSANSIAIKTEGEEHFTEVKYKIEPYKGSYNIVYDMLYDPAHSIPWRKESRGFWTVYEELYRNK
ncbi:hypothetical protein AM493_14325 [Flavobacterium akiainvivens]|uniref:DUF4488 domain-containing protein n=1 Tax=Flavobacterium akiainvivens TaxID=1202724 RepID=A0A0N0RQV9_9FLAO|nr:hypothetical protein [Flavobacterium akiainvivens]KOS07080.1 hypothetical protein AM493_14325 [Flavobacterium akiainvivens]SFQ58438.1 hypothetical protein SAMN05444144_1097 [Flavobacterium akiainvivens]